MPYYQQCTITNPTLYPEKLKLFAKCMWGELNPALNASYWDHDKNTVTITVNDLNPKPCHEQIKYYDRWMRELILSSIAVLLTLMF